jgi:sugar phosphate isomerase/epimerase
MNLNRRDFGKLALTAAAAPVGTLMAKVNSNFAGVQIGTITYSYRAEQGSGDAHQLLKMIVDSGVSTVELMPPAAENFAGSPAAQLQGSAGGGGGRGAPGGRGGPGGGGGQPRQMTPEQIAARETLRKWRLSASMDKFKEFRKLYNDAGVSIYCHKLAPSLDMSDEEYDYMFNVAAALGATQVSLELSDNAALTRRVGDFALKHNMVAAYHAHEQATISAWDGVLAQSKGNAVNLDCGHYYAGTGLSPVPVIEKLHDRIASIHLKDRTPSTPGGRGANLPWGTGSTPIADILLLMKKNKYKFPASVELEYQIPEGSDSVVEVKKCVEYCRRVLA